MGQGVSSSGEATLVLGPPAPTTDSTDPYEHAKFLPSLLKVPLPAGTGLGCYGAGFIFHGRGNAWRGTTFAGHWLHWTFLTRQILLLYSQDHSSLVVIVLLWPSGFLPPDATTVSFLLTWPRVLTPELLPLTLRRTIFFHARSGWLTEWFLLLRLQTPFRLRADRGTRAGTLLDYPRVRTAPRVTRAGLAPSLYRPRGSRYFPFCARPARVQGPTVVPLVNGASSLCTHRYRSTRPLCPWSTRVQGPERYR